MNTRRFSQTRPGCDVLLAVDAYLPWSGGSRIYYDNLYRRLAGWYGLSIRVETSHCEGDEVFDRQGNSRGLHIRRNGARLPDWSVKRAPALARKVLRIARAGIQSGPAAVHCGDLFPQDFAGMLLHKAAGFPFLVFVHGDEISQTERRRLQPRIRNLICRSADAVVAANSYAYERAIAICGGAQRVTMITPGVDCGIFRPGERPEWISREYGLCNSPVVVTVARLVKKKGHETVLRSLPTVLKAVPDLKYLVVGGGPEESRLKKLAAELGLGHCVRFTGDVPHHLLGDFYRAGDVFCMVNQEDASGDIESFGMVFIEAGASGKPVIGGRSGGTGQSIVDGKTGFLCPAGDSGRLCTLLLLLLENAGLRQRMGEAGLDRARQDFDWDLRAQQLFEIHQGIVNRESSSSQARQSCPVR
jgi:phosphatidylinositol alpha-1,6-mannosyltransferase